MSLRNPLARARGHGSAKEGVHHWWMQRLSAIALFFLLPWHIGLFIQLGGSDFQVVRAVVADPLNASLLALFVIALFQHARLGLQVVIEDYVGTRATEVALHVLTRFVYLAATVASLLAIIVLAVRAG
ncbi:MAG: succinate dehydrogenase, hydrophobic membrane anchor protein [Lysobacteraceae bacterium]